MSREAAVAFLATVAADANLRNELDACLEGATDEVGAFIELAAQKGHSFAPADLAEALRPEGYVDEEELDRVAGGLNPQPDPPLSYFVEVRSRYYNILGPALYKTSFSISR